MLTSEQQWSSVNGLSHILFYELSKVHLLATLILEQCQIDQMVMLTYISGVFLLFGKVTYGGKICGLFQKVT